MRVDGEGSGG